MQLMQLKATFIQVGCVLGAMLFFSMLFTILSSVQIRAGNIRFAMRSATVYVGLMSLVFLSFGGIAFYQGAHLATSLSESHAEYFHAKFNGLTILCGTMAGLVATGGFLLYKPYERQLFKSRQNRTNLTPSPR